MTEDHLSRRTALVLFAVVILAWGVNWTVAKLILASVPPLWMAAVRSAIAAVVLLALLLVTRNLSLPRRGDLPIVLSITLLHMVAYASFIAIGLQHVSAGRSIVLGYTTPLWVMPGAILFLGERLTATRVFGVVLGMAGIAVMFNPLAFDWSDARGLTGNGLILLAAFCWAVSILHIRGHKWISTPFQLVFWEVLLATAILSVLAFWFEGPLHIAWDVRLALLFLYGGVCGVALAYWAMAMVNRSLPAMTTSLGLLATPVVGIVSSMIVLSEPFSLALLAALALIVGGIALGTIDDRRKAAAASLPGV
jgi:drug/metabolite transporter (DMT)-like permease